MLKSKFYKIDNEFWHDTELYKSINTCLKQVMNDAYISIDEKAIYFYLYHVALSKYDIIYVITHSMRMDLFYVIRHLNIKIGRLKKALYNLCQAKYLNLNDLNFFGKNFSFGFNIPIYKIYGEINE